MPMLPQGYYGNDGQTIHLLLGEYQGVCCAKWLSRYQHAMFGIEEFAEMRNRIKEFAEMRNRVLLGTFERHEEDGFLVLTKGSTLHEYKHHV